MDDGWMIGRRRLLALGASGFLAAVLAACSKDDEPESTSAPQTTAGSETTGAPTTAGSTATTAGPATTAAGGGGSGMFGGGGGDGEIKIGWVTPATGPLAPFAAADDFIIGGIEDLLADGLMVGDKSYK